MASKRVQCMSVFVRVFAEKRKRRRGPFFFFFLSSRLFLFPVVAEWNDDDVGVLFRCLSMKWPPRVT